MTASSDPRGVHRPRTKNVEPRAKMPEKMTSGGNKEWKY